MEQKYKKQNELIERKEKIKQLSQHWAMLRWVTEFIHENQEKWDKERVEKEKEASEELEKWNKYRRFEKISKLKEKWEKKLTSEKETETPDIPYQDSQHHQKDWLVWRPRVEKHQLETGGLDITVNNLEDSLIEQPRYEGTKIIKQSILTLDSKVQKSTEYSSPKKPTSVVESTNKQSSPVQSTTTTVQSLLMVESTKTPLPPVGSTTSTVQSPENKLEVQESTQNVKPNKSTTIVESTTSPVQSPPIKYDMSKVIKKPRLISPKKTIAAVPPSVPPSVPRSPNGPEVIPSTTEHNKNTTIPKNKQQQQQKITKPTKIQLKPPKKEDKPKKNNNRKSEKEKSQKPQANKIKNYFMKMTEDNPKKKDNSPEPDVIVHTDEKINIQVPEMNSIDERLLAGNEENSVFKIDNQSELTSSNMKLLQQQKTFTSEQLGSETSLPDNPLI